MESLSGEVGGSTNRELLIRLAAAVDGHGRAILDHEIRLAAHDATLYCLRKDHNRLRLFGIGIALLAGGFGHLLTEWAMRLKP